MTVWAGTVTGPCSHARGYRPKRGETAAARLSLSFLRRQESTVALESVTLPAARFWTEKP